MRLSLRSVFLLLLATTTLAQTPALVQPTLTAPGSLPFHLKALITERGDPASKTEVEIFWVAPDKWRRTIQSQTEFSQTLIVNGDKVFEQDSDDYFPLGFQTLATAMVDPKPVLDAVRPGDRLETKANGGANESGTVCLFGPGKVCFTNPYGLIETVDAAGHSVRFTDYQEFKGKRVAHLVSYRIDPGDSLNARVMELKELKHPDDKLFSISQLTPKEKQIRSVIVPESELRSLAMGAPEIIWPQVLDGATTGSSTYHVSVDRSGHVQETLPLQTANERANDSARNQIMKWKFKPLIKDGVPVQAESILTFTTNTRAFGPPAPLSDAEVRKLATNIVDPVIPPGTAPSGTSYTLSAAIDHEGHVIEVIAGEGPPDLFQPCYQAMQKWHFSPWMENGQPRPYRAQITFKVP